MDEEKTKKTEEDVTWRAAERNYVEKGSDWYFVVVGVAILLVIISLWQKNFFFTIFIILAALVLISFGKRKPKVVDFGIHDDHIEIDHQIFEYDDLKSFAVKERKGRLNEIIIRKNSPVAPFLYMPISGKLAKKAESFLETKLEKFEHEVDFFDEVSDWLGL